MGGEQSRGQWGDGIKLDWSQKGEMELRQSLLESTGPGGIILMVFGNTGSGKSSLLNGFRSAIRGGTEVDSYFQVGVETTGKGTFTSSFNAASYCRKSCSYNCECDEILFWTVDMPGTFAGLSKENIKPVVTGEIPFYAQINTQLQVEDGHETLPPPKKVKASCVVIVAKAAEKLSAEVKNQINEIRALGGEGVLSVFLVLTHADVIDPYLGDPKGLPYIFQSKEVRKAVEYASNETGISSSCIAVVRNFTKETVTDTNTHVLLLHTLSRIIHAARQTSERDRNKASVATKLYGVETST